MVDGFLIFIFLNQNLCGLFLLEITHAAAADIPHSKNLCGKEEPVIFQLLLQPLSFFVTKIYVCIMLLVIAIMVPPLL